MPRRPSVVTSSPNTWKAGHNPAFCLLSRIIRVLPASTLSTLHSTLYALRSTPSTLHLTPCGIAASSVKCQVDAICFVQSGILSFVPIDWLLFSRDGCQVVFSYWIFARMRIIQFQFLSTLHLTLYIINKKHLRSTCYADVMQMLPYTLHLSVDTKQ